MVTVHVQIVQVAVVVVVVLLILCVAAQYHFCSGALVALLAIIGIKVLSELQKEHFVAAPYLGGDHRLDGTTTQGACAGPGCATALNPAKVDATMGPYDGVRLTTPCTFGGGWRHPPCTAPLQVPTRQNATVQGSQAPLVQPPANNEMIQEKSSPPVTGQDGDPRSMFMFAYNQSHPACCPSTYSTSTGCVCTTPQQRRWLAMRGSSRAAENMPAGTPEI